MEPNDQRVPKILSITLACGALGLVLLYVSGALTLGGTITGLALTLIGGVIALSALNQPSTPAPDAEQSGSNTDWQHDAALAAFHRLPDPVIWLDATGRVVLANEAAHSLLGNDPIDRHITAVLRTPNLLQSVSEVLDGGLAQRVSYTDPVPVERHFEALITPLTSPTDTSSETPSSVLIVLRDFTAIKRADQMRADFVANASHELRTPLASLTGFIETLKGPAREDAKARDKFLAIMEEQSTRMGRLIDDLLSLSRIELNEHVAPEDPVDIIALIHDVADACSPQARKQNNTFDITYQGMPVTDDNPKTKPKVSGDRDELFQVLQNLFDNALKYGRAEGAVSVDVSLVPAPDGTRDQLCVAVRDEGEGIAREHLPRLTERFYRVDVKRSRDRGGTGLGLAIVKHIVNRHRGRLEIESEEGQGSTFTVMLPLHDA